MKIQDIIFIIIFSGLLIARKPSWFGYAGLVCIVLAIPLYAKWVFFTAERLTWYGAAFLLVAMIFPLFSKKGHI
jgi:hypothetical protein